MTIEKGRWYPDMPPGLPGETDEQYTDRLTGADGTDRRPYDHTRFRQCSIGYHGECSRLRTGDEGCQCPCHDETVEDAEESGTALERAVAELTKKAWFEDAHGEVVLLSDATDALEVHFPFTPNWVSPPGETLRETLAARGISQAEASRRMGVSQPYVSNLLASRKGVGPETALKLEALTGVSGEFWARLWAQYAVGLARQAKARS